jgi:spermidine synthase
MFPLFLVPQLGLVRTSLVMGAANAGVALWGTWLLQSRLTKRQVVSVRLRAMLVVLGMIVGIGFADVFSTWAEDEMYADPIVYSHTSHYQRIVVTQNKAGFQLFLNGNLQFSSADEYRYHESLVHPAMIAADTPPRKVLVLGGGDGLGLREVLAHPSVEQVTLVDLDPAMTSLARSFPALAKLSRNALADRRVTVVNDDASVWIDGTTELWDAIIIDFPDPNTFQLGKLYTKAFYRRLLARLSPGGALTVQATSPLFARRSYWCIVETMRAAGFHVRPYQVPVPSFGVWGFALARRVPFEPPMRPPNVALRYVNEGALRSMFEIPVDMMPVPVEINQLDNQVLVRYYEREWRRWE